MIYLQLIELLCEIRIIQDCSCSLTPFFFFFFADRGAKNTRSFCGCVDTKWHLEHQVDVVVVNQLDMLKAPAGMSPQMMLRVCSSVFFVSASITLIFQAVCAAPLLLLFLTWLLPCSGSRSILADCEKFPPSLWNPVRGLLYSLTYFIEHVRIHPVTLVGIKWIRV